MKAMLDPLAADASTRVGSASFSSCSVSLEGLRRATVPIRSLARHEVGRGDDLLPHAGHPLELPAGGRQQVHRRAAVEGERWQIPG
jgi:hypothetical protein